MIQRVAEACYRYDDGVAPTTQSSVITPSETRSLRYTASRTPYSSTGAISSATNSLDLHHLPAPAIPAAASRPVQETRSASTASLARRLTWSNEYRSYHQDVQPVSAPSADGSCALSTSAIIGISLGAAFALLSFFTSGLALYLWTRRQIARDASRCPASSPPLTPYAPVPRRDVAVVRNLDLTLDLYRAPPTSGRGRAMSFQPSRNCKLAKPPHAKAPMAVRLNTNDIDLIAAHTVGFSGGRNAPMITAE